jgi:hypothetical protein
MAGRHKLPGSLSWCPRSLPVRLVSVPSYKPAAQVEDHLHLVLFGYRLNVVISLKSFSFTFKRTKRFFQGATRFGQQLCSLLWLCHLGLPAPASITLPSESKSHPAAASATLTTRSKSHLIKPKLSLTKTTTSKASYQPTNLLPLTSRTSTTSDVPSDISYPIFKSTVISAPECQELFYLFQQADQLARIHAYSHTTRDQEDIFTAELHQPEISTGMLTAPTLSLYTTSGTLHSSEVYPQR